MKPITSKITLTYLVVGLAWIFLSDWFIYEVIFKDSFKLLITQNIKGVGFVVVTSIILFIILHRNEKSFENLSNQFEHSFYKSPIPTGIFRVNDLSFIALNTAAQNLLGYDESELENMNILDIVPPEDISEITKKLNEGYDHKNNTRIWRLQKKTGERLHASMIITQTFFQGKECRMVMAIDAEQLMANQHLLKFKDEQLNAIQYISSHHVRRHLANLIGLSQLVENLDANEINDNQIGRKIEFSAKMLDKEIKNLVDEAFRQAKESN